MLDMLRSLKRDGSFPVHNVNWWFPLGQDAMRHHLDELYKQNLSLLTDLYQLTMAYGYWKSGHSDTEAAFHLFFRKNPFQGGYALACGLGHVIDFLKGFHFDDADLEYLSQLCGNDQQPLFEKGFLTQFKGLRFTCDIDAVPDGTVIFPHEPIVRVKGPIIQAQILESALLNIVNFQSLIATKAARIRHVAGDKQVIEFGLRRAQGVDGALSASLAAYIGGCDATSNVLAGKFFDIPVTGTHAHSWVMSFDDELESFRAYAKVMPNNCVFLVDTYDTIEGVKHAITIGQLLRQEGHELAGIRLDSGDLAYLSIEARKLLDDAGFANAVIVASNDLDENIIDSLNDQGAMVNIWGVGTKLVTGYDQPALGGVYKLTAIRHPHKDWEYKLKLSEQAIKISTPGIQQVRRYFSDGHFIGDVIFDELNPPKGNFVMVDPLDMTRRKKISQDEQFTDLLVPVFRNGQLVYNQPPLIESKRHASRQLSGLHTGIKRLLHPHQYPVGLEQNLHELKTKLTLKARGLA